MTLKLQLENADRIELAFKNGTGDCFMQKNNYSEIIAVSEYDIEGKEKEGFIYFSLFSYERPHNEIKTEPKENKKETFNPIVRESYFFNFIDDLPEFYCNNGL